MELGLSRAQNGEQEILHANHPEIRFFKVRQRVAYAPVPVPLGNWQVCSPQTAGENGGVSAVAYYFARKLQGELQVPIGLIQDCWGGSPAESWMGRESLAATGDFTTQLAEMDRLHAHGVPEYGSFLMHWLDEFDCGQSNQWQSVSFNDAGWKPVPIPGGFAGLGVPETPAVCWFRREVTLPDPLPSGQATLRLGVVEKMDTAYFNGQWVGASSWVENPRVYPIAAGTLKPGNNVLAVRVLKTQASGGFLSKPTDLQLVLGDQTVIPLAGEWKGALSVDARPPHPLPLAYENYPTMPLVLFHGMIQPVAPFSIRGAIWYQGEANFLRAHQYRTLLPLLIGDWRAAFQQGDFPFYIVGLPAFMAHASQPREDAWAELREAQSLTARTVKNAALVITSDIGDANDIHPKDKLPVGERLAWCALANEYGRDVVFSGPVFDSVTHQASAMQVHFIHAHGGLVAKGGQVQGFALAGQDRRWHWADAHIEGDAVVVSALAVPEPVAVRYAWQANPQATLFNGAGFPAAPFRTDDWPGVTEKAK